MTHSATKIIQVLYFTRSAMAPQIRPTVIIANTVKGKGVSFMEGTAKWHSGSLTPDQYATGLADLEKELLR